MSVLPATMRAPSASMSRSASTAPAGSGPLKTRSPATSVASGRSFLMALRTASSATALPWMSDRTASRRLIGHSPGRSPEHALAGDDEADRRLAGDLAVHRRDAASTSEAPPELLHRDLEPERVAGTDDAPEAGPVDAGEDADPVAEARLLRDVDRHRLGDRLHLEHAGHDRQPREVAGEVPLRRRHRLQADDPLRLPVVLHGPDPRR